MKFKTKSTTKLTGCDADDMWGITDMVQRFSFCSWVKRSDEWQVWQANRWHTFTWSVGVSCVQELVCDAECFCGCVDSCAWLQCDLCCRSLACACGSKDGYPILIYEVRTINWQSWIPPKTLSWILTVYMQTHMHTLRHMLEMIVILRQVSQLHTTVLLNWHEWHKPCACLCLPMGLCFVDPSAMCMFVCVHGPVFCGTRCLLGSWSRSCMVTSVWSMTSPGPARTHTSCPPLLMALSG